MTDPPRLPHREAVRVWGFIDRKYGDMDPAREAGRVKAFLVRLGLVRGEQRKDDDDGE